MRRGEGGRSGSHRIEGSGCQRLTREIDTGDSGQIVVEAVERLVDYNEWFTREVEKGLAQIDRGEVLTHEQVGARIERLLVEKQSRS